MLHHMTLWVPNLDRAAESWGWLLGELGWTHDDSLERVMLFRHATGSAIVLEESPDMVPGMLHSRFRPGLNHLAFRLDAGAVLTDITDGAVAHGWTALSGDRHPIAGGAQVAYLEDRDGFEVEIVAMDPV